MNRCHSFPFYKSRVTTICTFLYLRVCCRSTGRAESFKVLEHHRDSQQSKPHDYEFTTRRQVLEALGPVLTNKAYFQGVVGTLRSALGTSSKECCYQHLTSVRYFVALVKSQSANLSRLGSFADRQSKIQNLVLTVLSLQ